MSHQSRTCGWVPRSGLATQALFSPEQDCNSWAEYLSPPWSPVTIRPFPNDRHPGRTQRFVISSFLFVLGSSFFLYFLVARLFLYSSFPTSSSCTTSSFLDLTLQTLETVFEIPSLPLHADTHATLTRSHIRLTSLSFVLYNTKAPQAFSPREVLPSLRSLLPVVASSSSFNCRPLPRRRRTAGCFSHNLVQPLVTVCLFFFWPGQLYNYYSQHETLRLTIISILNITITTQTQINLNSQLIPASYTRFALARHDSVIMGRIH